MRRSVYDEMTEENVCEQSEIAPPFYTYTYSLHLPTEASTLQFLFTPT